MEAIEGARGMPTADRKGEGPRDDHITEERASARDRAHWLVKEVQDRVPGAADEVAALIERARGSGWPEVLRAALYADAVATLVANNGNFRRTVNSFRQQAELDGEPVMEALALALGSWDEIGGGDPEAAVAADADLGRATVILELAEGLDHCDSYERASAHIAAAVSYGYRRLWELEDKQYQRAESVLLPGEEKFLRAVVLFNRAELQMKWACALREIGEPEDLELHCQLGRQAVRAAQQIEMPRTWRAGLSILELMFAGLIGEDVSEIAEGMDAEGPEPYYEFAAHLKLAAALSHASNGRRHASSESAELVLAELDPATRPTEYDLALSLLAEQNEPVVGELSPALRYARRQARLRWQSRLTALASMRSLVQGERLRGEHALFRRHAFLDDLTGLANRREFYRFMAVMAAKGVERVTLILCDVDRFKEVNDNWGHPVGDLVLVEVASLLSASVRSADLAARLGGDEFALLLDDLDVGAAELRAAGIVRGVAERSWSHVQPGLGVRVSVGLAVGHPGRPDDVLRRADVALYQAKTAGGSRCMVAR
jgi:diguanylate cyclase (GGDEF)-like protein